MYVFYLADIEGNTGPSNANRSFYNHWPDEDVILTLPTKGNLRKLASAVFNSLRCDIVITTGPSKVYKLVKRIMDIRNKPICAFCHGYAPYENVIEHLNLDQHILDDYVRWIESSNVVVTNSVIQKELIERYHPQVHIEVVHLGVDSFIRTESDRVGGTHGKLTVSVSGGTRFCKGNEVVAKAVDLLIEQGYEIELRVYGRQYAANEQLDACLRRCGKYYGQVDRRSFLMGLQDSDIFVMNSRHESFGLSSIDALGMGCSLLISTHCGVKEILNLNESDLIYDTEDANEIARKIKELLLSPNGMRLANSIDFDRTCWSFASRELREICAQVVGE